ncbi:MAG: response regulator, partial [Candidatus Manganitrophaceae bacterium]
LDLMLPKKSGFEVCQELKKNSDTKDIPILMITAKVDPLSRKNGLALGACEYLTKPLNPREILQKVKEHLPRAAGE